MLHFNNFYGLFWLKFIISLDFTSIPFKASAQFVCRPFLNNYITHIVRNFNMLYCPSNMLRLMQYSSLKGSASSITFSLLHIYYFDETFYMYFVSFYGMLFCGDEDSTPEKLIFKRIATLRDNYGKA